MSNPTDSQSSSDSMTDRLSKRAMSALSIHDAALKAQGLPPRGMILAGAVAVTTVLILAGGILFGGRFGAFWFGRGAPNFQFPFSIQNLMHILMAIGLAELFVRAQIAKWESAFLSRGLLPEDEESVLQISDLGAIRRKVANQFEGDAGFLPGFIDLVILRLQTSRSVDQAVNVLNASLNLVGERVDLRYQLVRYLVWVIPTIGFIGTVVGIAGALAFVDPDQMDLQRVTASLSIAFDTTVIALLWSAILVLAQHAVQKREELALNRAGQYCLNNLINRIYVDDAIDGA